MERLVALALLLCLGAHAELALKMLPDAVSKGAVCIDGTAPGYYFKKGTGTGTNSWIIFFQGGGWCYSESDCYARSTTDKGTSTVWKQTMTSAGILYEDENRNPDFYNWNLVHLNYCDGASFTGNRDDPVVVKGKPLYFRGLRVLQAIIEDLKSQGMDGAKEILVSGCSAGGLAAFLHADRLASAAPQGAKYRVVPGSGFFLFESNLDGVPVYPLQMKGVFEMQNSTGGVPSSCIESLPVSEQWRCISAPTVYQYIQSPMFIMNSAYDSWSMQCILTAGPVPAGKAGDNCSAFGGSWRNCTTGKSKCNQDQLDTMTSSWNTHFMSTITSSKTFSKIGNGAFVSSCLSHCGENKDGWNKNSIGGVSIQQAVSKWWKSDSEPAKLHTRTDCQYSTDTCCNGSCCKK